MKKVVALLFALAIALPAFGYDARVLSPGTLRITVAPAYAFADKQYYLGAYEDLDILHTGASRQTLSYVNVGIALEFGLLNWMTADAQWIPGWTLYSGMDFTPDLFAPSKVNINGVDDLLVGLKLQLVGEKGILPSGSLRLLLEPSAIFGMPDVDWDAQQAQRAAGQDFTIMSLAKHASGYGVKVLFDFYLVDFLFFTLWIDYRSYLPRENAQLSPGMTRSKIEWRPDIAFGIEPHIEFNVGDGIRLAFGAPLGLTSYGALYLDGVIVTGTLSTLVLVTPHVGVAFTGIALPLEVDLKVPITLYAADLPVFNSAVLEIKTSIPLW